MTDNLDNRKGTLQQWGSADNLNVIAAGCDADDTADACSFLQHKLTIQTACACKVKVVVTLELVMLLDCGVGVDGTSCFFSCVFVHLPQYMQHMIKVLYQNQDEIVVACSFFQHKNSKRTYNNNCK